MKKKLIPLALVGLIYQGCGNNVPKPNTPVKFYTPAKLSVIENGPKIYIKGLNDYNYNSKVLKKGIKDYFKKDGIFSIVENIKKADVIIIINIAIIANFIIVAFVDDISCEMSYCIV